MTFDPLLIPVISFSFVDSLNSLAFNTIHKQNIFNNDTYSN